MSLNHNLDISVTIVKGHSIVLHSAWHQSRRHKKLFSNDRLGIFTCRLSLFRFLCPIALSPEEQVRDTLEVLLHYYTQALSIETVAREVAVICLVVDINGKITIGEE